MPDGGKAGDAGKAGERMRIQVPMDRVKRAGDLSQLAEKVYYLSVDIKHVSWDAGGMNIEYTGADGEELLLRLDALCTALAAGRKLPYKRLRDNRSPRRPKLREASAEPLYAGSPVLQGAQVLLEQAVVRLLRTRADAAGAVLRKYPTLIPEEVIRKSGYLRNFPQNVYAVSEFRHQFDTLEGVRSSLSAGEPLDSLMQPSGAYMQPCVCYHVYEECSRDGLPQTDPGSEAGAAGCDFAAAGGSGREPDERMPGPERGREPVPEPFPFRLFSAYGTCYRHEHDSRISESRLREFGMFEMVYIGAAEAVKQMRADLLEDTWALFGALGLQGYVESASDPFFLPEDGDRRMFQLAAESKFELRCTTSGGDDFAVTSFNVCGDVLCRAFGIGGSGSYPHSGCTAFGVDRWVQAILDAWGPDPAGWPALIRGHL
ncbi:aminoacyl--tRNA ligase-related protein [Paenibacillus lutrae]|nr:aminoacyl--tRNA ligase-related protein [Paenibacillus lutrae]